MLKASLPRASARCFNTISVKLLVGQTKKLTIQDDHVIVTAPMKHVTDGKNPRDPSTAYRDRTLEFLTPIGKIRN